MNMARQDVVITGMGVISPIGQSIAELHRSVLDNRSGIQLWESALLSKGVPAGIIADDFSSQFSKIELPYMDRCSQIAILAAEQAMQDAGIDRFESYAQRAGLYYGSVGGGVQTEHEWVRQFHVNHVEVSKPFTIMASMLNAAPALISIRHKILGPVVTNSSACSSSGAAIGEACRAIRDGYLDIALVGGAEAALSPTFISLWGGLRALASVDADDVTRSCRPFSIDRSGLVVSEGSVFLVVESRAHAEQRGANCYAKLSGYGIASDGHHIGSPNALGQAAALRAALADATLAPEQIDYYNAHATATRGGDPIEAAAIREVFGDSTERLPVSSTKGIHGHLLGAASAIELAICVLAVCDSFLPATAHLVEPDPECGLQHVAGKPVPGHALEHAMSLSAGFGGTNVALAVSKEHDLPRRTLPAESSVNRVPQ
ncbi:MAG TPA: beta-ketoacyl-[acyl-carrier-protein] synthase family protein [Dokdonella sp.]|uniref:beta-ketoacyl-[acyl-carrier-protein] synthase family protein n=1 Tax=Dokdonella sp. TaxID=2291710 RepID=UPI002D7FFA74|nr:beta-ketoacyl-[acyl-carrier-protein] synthase family protein [Dokdonella sp.]HET9032758.1 beta-ketoacyl-[acyl-carrier-protein] synthase family protein [Dokdonella sp.]